MPEDEYADDFEADASPTKPEREMGVVPVPEEATKQVSNSSAPQVPASTIWVFADISVSVKDAYRPVAVRGSGKQKNQHWRVK